MRYAISTSLRAGSVALFALGAGACTRSHLARVDHVALAGPLAGGRVDIVFDVSWPDAFRDSVHWDATWTVFKYRTPGGSWRHATLVPSPGTVARPHGVPARITPTPDGTGVFGFRRDPGRGLVNWDGVRIIWAYADDGVPDGTPVELRAFTLEMAYVPAGPFYLGDGETADLQGHFRRGRTAEPFPVLHDGAIALGSREDSALTTFRSARGAAGADDFDDDTPRILPPAFPAGFDPFYVMKYELTQGQYAVFLNTLDETARAHRNPARAGIGPGRDRYTITAVAPHEAAVPDRAAHHLTWTDAAAFADWAGLRPITELEFEKAARGPTRPDPGGYAWGTTELAGRRYALRDRHGPQERIVNPATWGNALYAVTAGGGSDCWSCIAGPVRVDAFSDTPARRAAGTSYFGLRQLSGNLAERVVTVGHPAGRRFTGAAGDGTLGPTGDAWGPEVATWPGSTRTGARSRVTGAIGSGLRGGGWSSPASALRVSDRRFATAADNRRRADVGYRFGRSALPGPRVVP